VGLIGMWRAFNQLQQIGWVSDPLPRMIAVQAAGCAPLVRALDNRWEESTFWEGASTIAAGLRVPKALGDFLVLRAIRDSGGTAVAVTDEQIIAGMRRVGAETGVACAPEGAATYAALEGLLASGAVRAGERVVLINTGTALKYPEALAT
jgi:threonine synthase